MKLQIIHDGKGKDSGVFIPIEEWNMIKNAYPDIEHLDEEIPESLKQLLDARLKDISENPDSVKPIEGLFDELDN